MTATAQGFDLTDPDLFVAGGHHDVFRMLRVEEPVHWHATDQGGFWALTRYEDIVAAYKDAATFSSAAGVIVGGSFGRSSDTAAQRMLVAADPPRHRMLRQIVHNGFLSSMVDRVREQITALVDRGVRQILRDGGCDFAVDIAPLLPTGALMAMMDLDEERAGRLLTLTRRMIGYRDPEWVDTGDDEQLRLAGLQADVFEFFDDLIAERRAAPGDDLVSILINAEVNGRPMSVESVLYNCMNLAVGGNETSSHSACTGFLALVDNPGQWDLLTRAGRVPETAVNEIVRWASANAYVQRVAQSTTRIGDKIVRAGEAVTLWNVSGNRDEEQFPDPDVFDVTRNPNRHLSFGVGIHRCIGATLAGVELSVLFDGLVATGVRFARAGEVRRLRSNFILGTNRLPIEIAG